MVLMPTQISRRNPIILPRLFALLLCLWAISPAPALAQQDLSTTPQQRADSDLLTFFYKDPRPQRLVGFLDKAENTYTNWNAFPPFAGFFAVVFRAHPDWIERLVPANINSRAAPTISAALQLAGQPAISQSLQSRLANAASDQRLSQELANLPARIEDLRITLPTHFDILWGAFFASGDSRYVRPILDFFAKTANRSELVALDVTKTAVAMSGGPQDILSQLKGKYGDAVTVEIVYAATAEWGLSSNATRHPAVDSAVTAYIAENPKSYATKSLSVFRRGQHQ